MAKGIFISFEGLDGSGKSTQIAYLKEFLEEKGMDVFFAREPGSTAIGEKIRTIILDKENAEMAPVTEALLYAAARAQLVSQEIRPRLERGQTVILDRYIDSSIAYQSYGRGLGDVVKAVNAPAVDGCMPDLTFFVDVDPKEGRSRMDKGRDALDRLESEKAEFHERVYKGYMAVAEAEPGRVRVIDGRRSREEIRDEMIGIVQDFLDSRK